MIAVGLEQLQADGIREFVESLAAEVLDLK